MSRRARAAGWVAAFVVVGDWSWHQAGFNGLQLAVIIGLLTAAAVLAHRGIDQHENCDELDRAADPRRFNGERP